MLRALTIAHLRILFAGVFERDLKPGLLFGRALDDLFLHLLCFVPLPDLALFVLFTVLKETSFVPACEATLKFKGDFSLKSDSLNSGLFNWGLGGCTLDIQYQRM